MAAGFEQGALDAHYQGLEAYERVGEGDVGKYAAYVEELVADVIANFDSALPSEDLEKPIER